MNQPLSQTFRESLNSISNQIKDMMGSVHSMHRRDEKCCTPFWPEDLKGRDYLEALGTDGMIILNWTLRKQKIRL
jgi:hypothetical protein